MRLQEFLADPRCIFCGIHFVRWNNYWQCPIHNGDDADMGKGIWCSYWEMPDNIDTLNIVVNGLQVYFDLKRKATIIYSRPYLREIIRFDHLLDLPLEPELLLNKLKTIAVFS